MRPALKELVLPLLIAAIHGAVYLFMVPPWQHYDEPGHMEYVWHIAHKQQLPLPSDVDREMRFDFVESMARHGFYNDLGGPPQLDRANGPTPDIGFSQLDDAPTYYVLAALPVSFVLEQSIEMQLYAARSASIFLLLICIVCAWGVARELSPPGHALRWMLPFSVALLPPFVDLMTAVNNDAGAIAAYSLFLWGATRLIRRNSDRRGTADTTLTTLWVLASAVLCLAVKASAASAVAVAAPALIFGLAPIRLVRASLFGVLALAAGVAMLVFRSGDAQAWYRTDATARAPLTQCAPPACGQTAHGAHAVRVASDSATPGRLIQSLPADYTSQLRGQTVTIAGWAWAEGVATNATLPQLSVNYRPDTPPSMALDTTPTFFAYTRTVPADASYIHMTLTAPPNAALVYDGLLMITGEAALDQVPIFADAQGAVVRWAGASYTNMIRNGSGEASTLALRPAALTVLDAVTPSWMVWPLGVSSLLDLRGSGWYYALAATNMFESFWGRFAWGHVAILSFMFPVILLVCAVCLLAAIRHALAHRTTVADMLPIIATYAFATAAVLISGSMRGISTGLEVSLWLPGARYAFPAVAILLLPLVLGCGFLLKRLGETRAARVFASIWLLLALTGIATVIGYYYGVAGL